MGQTLVTLLLHGSRGSESLEALVDTGATFTKVPRSTAERLGVLGQYEVPTDWGTAVP
ncbi:MAG: hypothetical protein HYY01_03050 [Chloroflexi bacterium]|nr:hypothetical protein [Chloroflexota bacterium]